MPGGSEHPSGLPLPKHFVEKETDAGRKYYINHKEGKTTWIDPRDAVTKKTSWAECGPDEMPYGWEERVDEKCELKYWIDHNNQVCTIDDPRLADDRKEQEIMLKSKVDELKKGMGRNRMTLRKSKMKLDVVKKKYEEIKEGDDSESAKQARMEYRRHLSMTNRVQRVVEEAEAKISALETIECKEMTVEDASKVKEELAKLNESYQKELKEKEQIKTELQELRDLVTGYMTSMKKETGKSDELSIKAEGGDVAESENSDPPQEAVDALTLEVPTMGQVAAAPPAPPAAAPAAPAAAPPAAPAPAPAAPAAAPAPAAPPVAPPVPPAASSMELQIELEQRKLEHERQRKETEELKKAQRELRLLKERVAAESKKHSLPFHEIEEEDLPDWLFSSHVVKLLDIEGDDFDNDKDLQAEIKLKVKDYMSQQKEDADGMNFKSKLAFFTTLEIHEDVQRRKSDNNRSRPASMAGRSRSSSNAKN